MAISVALLGLGLGGIFVSFNREKLRRQTSYYATLATVFFSLYLVIYLCAISQFPFSLSLLPLYFFASVIPFFFAGVCAALVFDGFAHITNKIYFADLTGASIGCVSAEAILSFFGAESAILLIGLTASVASILFALTSRKRRLLGLSLIVLFIVSFTFTSNLQHPFIGVLNAPAKGMFQILEKNPELKIVSTKWNSFSRVDVVEGPVGNDLAYIFIDADASTVVLKWDGKLESAQYLNKTIDFLPYYLVDEPKVLIIGSGGGRDVLIALVGNSSGIVAVELNPIIVDATKNYGEKAGNIYNNGKVEVSIDEGRSFVSRSNKKYDVIVLTLVDSWAAFSAGGYALAENYLYTVEAFKQYLDHLSDNGLLVMIRWSVEVPRLVSTAIAALQEKGKSVSEAGNHMAIILENVGEPNDRALFLLKRTPFTESEAQKIENKIPSIGSRPKMFHAPYVYEAEYPYNALFNGSISLSQFNAYFTYRTEPVYDNNPFYFCAEKPIPWTLTTLIQLTLTLSFVFIGLPMVLRRRSILKDMKNSLSAILFFSALGLGYMIIEISLLQKFILFLGYPTRALSVILFSLLLSSGIGSLVSSWRIEKANITKRIQLACLSIIFIVIAYLLLLPNLFATWLPYDSSIRIIISIILLIPLGFFMGIPFPSGLRTLEELSSQSIPWMWGINGIMSVFGSVITTAIGILFGFSQAFLLGASAYFIAFLCVNNLRK
jgi:spermidine synthase